MKLSLEELRRDIFNYGWINSSLLLLFLTLVPLLLPTTDTIPKPAMPAEQNAAARPHNRVVLLIVDGLGYRRAVDPELMPRLRSRMRTNAAGTALAAFPTVTLSGLRAFMSGHRATSGSLTSAEPDSVLAHATQAGLKCFVVGESSWAIFPAAHGARFIKIAHGGISLSYDHGSIVDLSQDDEHVLDAARPIIQGLRGPWDLLVLHLFESDHIGHALGTASGFYPIHLRWLDQKIEELSRLIQEDRPTTFLLVADHGQTDAGSHGGMSSEERQVPFVLWGAGIKPGDLGTFPLYDTAPTLSALLGIEPPTFNEGWPRVEALQLTQRQRANVMMDLLRQRLVRWRTVKAAFPWLRADPEERLAESERLYQAKKFDAATSIAEQAAHGLDKDIDDTAPREWLRKIIAALWVLVLAACFGLAWNQSGIKSAKLAAVFSAACLLLLALPLLRPAHWPLVSNLVLAASVGIMGLALIQGLKSSTGPRPLEWSLWWLALLGIAFQEFLDLSLWSWLVLAGLFLSRALHLTRQNSIATALSLSSVFLCSALIAGSRSTGNSLMRSFLPVLHWPAMADLPWGTLALILLGAWMIVAYFTLVRFNDEPRPWRIYAWGTGPAVAAVLLTRFQPFATNLTWTACAASLAGLIYLRPAPDVRGMWLSALALAYYRTLTDERQWCFLVLAVVVGWTLAWKSRDAHPLWEGLGLLGIGLWSYQLSGGSFSLTIWESPQALGQGPHSFAITIVPLLKCLTVVAAPILPRLSTRPLYSVLGILPLLGALSAGNLTMFWYGRFNAGNMMEFTATTEFSQIKFVLILAWLVLGLWLATQVVALISERTLRPKRS